MATDKSEPKVGLIVQLGVISIVTLVLVRAGLVSYFNQIADEETYVKVGAVKNEELIKLREEEKARLQAGPLPIDKAMAMLARGRTGQGTEAIAPKPATDNDALAGWKLMPRPVPPPPPAAPAAPEGAAEDGGAPATTEDGGTPAAVGADAGAEVAPEAGTTHSTNPEADPTNHP